MTKTRGGGALWLLSLIFFLSSLTELYTRFPGFKVRGDSSVPDGTGHALKREFRSPFLNAIVAAPRVKTVDELGEKKTG